MPANKIFKLIKEHKILKGKRLFIVILAIVVLEAGATEIYILSKGKLPLFKPQTDKITQEQTENKKRAVIVDVVQKQVELPVGEEPIMATVTDAEAVKNQEFFEEAQVGDKILMYRNARKAFLYRPSTQKVLVQAPLRMSDDKSVAGAATISKVPESEPLQSVGGSKELVNPEGKIKAQNKKLN